MVRTRRRRALGSPLLLAPIALAGCYSGHGGDGPPGAEGPTRAPGAGGEDADDDDDGDDDDDDDDAVSCDGFDVGNTPLRRLTREQYDNTLRDLLGVTDNPSTSIESDERIGPFYSNAIAPVAALTVEQYMQVAENIADEVTATDTALDGIVPCAPGSFDDACAEAFIDDFGPRAYRRPLTAEERATFVALYEQGRDDESFATGIRLVVQLGLQSPHFLYHVEETTDVQGELAFVDPYTLASRLSYFLWASMPDDALFEAAGSGGLDDVGGIAEQVDRMLADPRSSDAISSFHLQWFGIAEIDELQKDSTEYPGFSTALAEGMRTETETFVRHVLDEGDGRLATLLSAPYSIPNAETAAVYGDELPADFQPGDLVTFDTRAGLLTQPSVLAAHAHENQTSPVLRGVFVRENILCDTLPPPPPEVDNTPPAPDPDATTRERFEQHNEDPACSGCHVLIDGLGLGFEHYDALGAWRDEENGREVDATGFVTSTTNINGDFYGAVELAQMLGTSEDVEVCTVRQWFRFSLGRTDTDRDECVVQSLAAKFSASDGDVRELMLAIATSEAFRYRRVQ